MAKTESRKRGNGEGSVRQRPDGRWEGRYRTPDGKQHSVYGRTRREAQEKLRAAQRDLERGLDADRGKQRLDSFLDSWLEDARPRLRPKTIQMYEHIVRLHLKPALGRHRLKELTPQHVQSFLNAQSEQGLSAQTVRHHRAVLRGALEQALKWQLVDRNVAKVVTPPRLMRKPVNPLTAEQARVFLKHCEGDPLGPLFQMAIVTGMRQGELFRLLWEDVDTAGRTVNVLHALQRNYGQSTFVEPKSPTSRRYIPLPEMAIVSLEVQQALQYQHRLVAGMQWHDTGLVFTTPRGTPLDGSNVNKRLHRLLAEAGLPRQRFHDLRHCSASLLLDGGVDMRTIMGRLGHSQISLTMNTYAHLSPRLERNAAAVLDSLLGPANVPSQPIEGIHEGTTRP